MKMTRKEYAKAILGLVCIPFFLVISLFAYILRCAIELWEYATRKEGTR